MKYLDIKDLRIIFKNLGDILLVIGMSLFIIGLFSFIIDYKNLTNFIFLSPGIFSLIIGLILINIKDHLLKNSEFLNIPSFHSRMELRHTFILSAITWLLIPLFCSIPFFMFSSHENLLSIFIDSYFEAMSAFTGAGLTMMQNLDNSSQAFLFFRSGLAWIGGVGIIMLFLLILTPSPAVAKLYSAEARTERIKATMRGTVKEIWKIYIFFTILGFILLLLVGMNSFDALTHAMTSLATQGFSTHNSSIGYYYNNWTIQIVLMFLMIVGAISFYIYFQIADQLKEIFEYLKAKFFGFIKGKAYKEEEKNPIFVIKDIRNILKFLKNKEISEELKNIFNLNGEILTNKTNVKIITEHKFEIIEKNYNVKYILEYRGIDIVVYKEKSKILTKNLRLIFHNLELRTMIMLIVVGTIIIFLNLHFLQNFAIQDALKLSSFNVVSAVTTTGFVNGDIGSFDNVSKLILILLMIIGGSSGSTAGGIKIIKFLILSENVVMKIKKVLLPEKAVFTVKLMNVPLTENEISYVSFLIFIFISFYLLGVIIFLYLGYSPMDSLFVCASAISDNGINTLSGDLWFGMNDIGKVVLIFLMYAGRLEILPVLALIVAIFSRK